MTGGCELPTVYPASGPSRGAAAVARSRRGCEVPATPPAAAAWAAGTSEPTGVHTYDRPTALNFRQERAAGQTEGAYMTVTRFPIPTRLRGDSWCETWEVACGECGALNEFALGVHPLVASAWCDEAAFTDHCPRCGMPLPDEHDTAARLSALRTVA